MARVVKEHDVRRSEILNVAQTLFYQKGYEQTSVSDIINTVGIAKGTFYHYFNSKTHLLDELIEGTIEQTMAMVRPIVQDQRLSAIEKFQRFFRDIEHWKVDNKAFLLDILRVVYHEDNAIFQRKLQAAAGKAMTPLLGEIICQGVEEGVFNTPYAAEIGDFILTLSQTMGEETAAMLLAHSRGEDALPQLWRKVAVYRDSIERLLGAPPGVVRIYETLDEWFE